MGRDGTRDDRSPLYFSARLFLRDDPAVATLAELLAESRAEDWHATEGNSLFGHPDETRLLDAIFACDSWLYTMYSTYGEYRREEVHDQFLAELDADPRLRTDWRLEQLQGIALLRFASFLRGRIAEQVALGTLKAGRVSEPRTWASAKDPAGNRGEARAIALTIVVVQRPLASG